MNKLLVLLSFVFFIFVNVQQCISCHNINDETNLKLQEETRVRAIENGAWNYEG